MSRLLRSLLPLLAAGAMLVPTAAGAAETFDITFEPGVDFRALRTFAIRGSRIASDKPEIDNRLFRQRMEDSIRAALKKQGLTEDTTRPDVWLTYSFDDRDVSGVDRQPARRIPDSPQARGFVIPGSGPTPVLYTEGTLVIDFADAAGSLLWRGTYRDRETSGPRLSRNLSEDARRLLSKFPPRSR